jgi:hypothetical protein
LELYNEAIKRTHATCKRLENIVLGVITKLEDPSYQREAPMSKQLQLANKATSVLTVILQLIQELKIEGAEMVREEEKTPDPRINAAIERIRKLIDQQD